MLKVEIRNPSEYPRPQHERHPCEYVFIPWAQIAAADPDLSPDDVAAYTADGVEVPCVVVRHGPADRVLAIRIEEQLPAAADQTAPYTLQLGPAAQAAEDAFPELIFQREGQDEAPAEPRNQIQPGRMKSVVRVRMINELLNVWFDLGDHFGKFWFAGAASSVQLMTLEMLDDYRIDPFHHDLEKRCMQIDRVTVSRPGWEDLPVAEYPLFTPSYTLVDYAGGPVAVSITIASPERSYEYDDPFAAGRRTLECRLFRRLTLFAGVNYVIEEVWMRGEAKELAAPVDFCFTARYFSYMEMGQPPNVMVHEGAPGWSAISMPHAPRQGYGFATDAPLGGVQYPHPGYPDPDRRHRTFSWEVGPCRGYRCMHLFHRASPDVILENTERVWNELISEPLRADIVSPQPVGAGATGSSQTESAEGTEEVGAARSSDSVRDGSLSGLG